MQKVSSSSFDKLVKGLRVYTELYLLLRLYTDIISVADATAISHFLGSLVVSFGHETLREIRRHARGFSFLVSGFSFSLSLAASSIPTTIISRVSRLRPSRWFNFT